MGSTGTSNPLERAALSTRAGSGLGAGDSLEAQLPALPTEAQRGGAWSPVDQVKAGAALRLGVTPPGEGEEGQCHVRRAQRQPCTGWPVVAGHEQPALLAPATHREGIIKLLEERLPVLAPMQ